MFSAGSKSTSSCRLQPLASEVTAGSCGTEAACRRPPRTCFVLRRPTRRWVVTASWFRALWWQWVPDRWRSPLWGYVLELLRPPLSGLLSDRGLWTPQWSISYGAIPGGHVEIPLFGPASDVLSAQFFAWSLLQTHWTVSVSGTELGSCGI